MTIWTQFLPGVRETRVPLAVGSIWVVVAAILFRHLPRAVRDGELFESVGIAIQAVPTPVVIGAVLFGAYLLGVVLTEVGNIVVAVVAGLWNLVPIVFTCLLAVVLVLGYFPQLALGSAIVAFIAWVKWRRLDDVPYLEYLSQVLSHGYLAVLAFYGKFWNDLKVAWDPSKHQIDYMVRAESNRALATSSDLVARLVRQLPVRLLAEVVRSVRLQESDFQRALVAGAPDLQPMSLSKAVRQVKANPVADSVIRAALTDRIAGNTEARRAFIQRAVSTSKLRADTRDRVERAHVQLRAQYEGVYNEYDRLRAEGEFRTSIAVPLSALLGASGFLLIRDTGMAGDAVYVVYITAAVAGMVMLAAGSTKKSEAADLLYSSIRQQLIKNEDTRDYGIEYFPIKYYWIDIDLQILRPSFNLRSNTPAAIRRLPIVRRFFRKYP